MSHGAHAPNLAQLSITPTPANYQSLSNGPTSGSTERCGQQPEAEQAPGSLLPQPSLMNYPG